MQEQHPLPVNSISNRNNQKDICPEASLYCFSCKQTGYLVYCANCPKQFHFKCLNTKENQQTLQGHKAICKSCQLRTICPECDRAVSNDSLSRYFSKLVCTVCYRMIHQQCRSVCNKIDSNLLYSENHSINQIVCNKCLFSCGIQTLVKSGMTASGKFWLVNPYYCSNVHIGWFEEDECHEVFTAQTKRSHNNLAKQLNEKTFVAQCKIDKILKVYSPIVYKQLQIESVIFHLFSTNRQLQYGSPINFRFLVKWSETLTQSATWEDEYLIIKRAKSELQDYLKYCLYAYDKITIDQLRRSARNRYKKLVNQNELESQTKFLQLKYHYAKCSSSKQHRVDAVNFISNIFYLNPSLKPIIVITSDPQLWYSILVSDAPHLRSVHLNGPIQNRNYQFQDELFLKNHTMFDVLVMSYDVFVEDLQRITRIQYGGAVFDCQAKYSRIGSDILDAFEEVGKIVLYQNQTNTLLYKITQMTTQHNKYQMQIKEKIQHNQIVQFNEQQRLFFLRFVLTLGLNIDNPQELLEKLVEFQNRKTLFENNSRTVDSLKCYLKDFMTELQDHESKYYTKYFEQFDKETVINRIASLSSLKYAYQYYSNRVSKYPLSPQFQIASVRRNGKILEISSHAWKPKDDLELMRLILKHGYSRWRQICQDFFRENSNVFLKGYEYLVPVLWPQINQSPDVKPTVQKIIQIRAGILVNHKTFQDMQQIPKER